MPDPIPAADELLDTSTMRRLRRRRDALPDLAVSAALLLLFACVLVAAAHSLTAGLVTTLLAVIAALALWCLTTPPGGRAVAWLGAWAHAVRYRAHHSERYIRVHSR